MRVALQVFSFRESVDLLRETLDSFAACREPDFVSEISYEAHVTPRYVASEPGSVTARHRKAAESHAVFEYVEAPQGKLSARNAAHGAALDDGFDLIVSGDADAPPVRADYLERITEPFTDPGVVGANSHPIADTLFGMVGDFTGAVEDKVLPHMHGQGAAFTTDAWGVVGPFDTDIDETDVHEVRPVEEFGFYRDLSGIGRVVHVGDALVINSSRRYLCRIEKQFGKLGRPVRPYCAERGEHTFQPR